MQSIINSTKAFIRDEDGVTAIEYGLIAALIAGVIVLAVTNLGLAVQGTFNTITAAI